MNERATSIKCTLLRSNRNVWGPNHDEEVKISHKNIFYVPKHSSYETNVVTMHCEHTYALSVCTCQSKKKTGQLVYQWVSCTVQPGTW